jgi:hypothetical protein
MDPETMAENTLLRCQGHPVTPKGVQDPHIKPPSPNRENFQLAVSRNQPTGDICHHLTMAASESAAKPSTGDAPTKPPGTVATAPKAKTSEVPTRPGFKLVKLRMPDGTIKRAWRPITNIESAPVKQDGARGSETNKNTEVTPPNESSASGAAWKQIVSDTKPESLNTTSSEDKPPSYTAAVESEPTTSTTIADSSPAKQAVGEPKNADRPLVVAESSKTAVQRDATASTSTTAAANASAKTSVPAPRGRRSRFRRFWVGVGQTLAPELNLGDIDTPHAGDEIISDDDWPSNSDDSDDDRDRGGRRPDTQGRNMLTANHRTGDVENGEDIRLITEDTPDRKDVARSSSHDGEF